MPFEDDLKIGFGVDGWLRPTRFEMGQDQVGWLLVLTREREDKNAQEKPEADNKEETTENTKDIEELLSLTGHPVVSAYGTVQSDGWCRVCVSAGGPI